jgi:Ca-activated chloride channel family protein
MDERHLRDILGSEEFPPADENARKQAVNLALAAFDDAQREKRKTRQGTGLLHRLTGRSNQSKGRRPMTTRFAYGGAATATAVVIGIGVYGILGGYVGDRLTPMFSSVSNELDTSVRPDRHAVNPEYRVRELADAAPSGTAVSKDEEALPASVVPAERQSRIAGSGSKPSPQTVSEADAPARPSGGSGTPLPPARAAGERQAAPGDAFHGLLKNLAREQHKLQSIPALPPPSAGATSSRVVEARPQERPRRQYEATGRDRFAAVEQNTVKRVADAPVSTFSIDVDTASYGFVRRVLNRGVLPQKNAVRIEELINYFDYDYPVAASRERPFEPTITVLPSPWKTGNKLIHIGIKGYELDRAEAPRSNLVFLLDVSGSMRAADKLPLVVSSMKLLLETLRPDDTVAIVVYAGAAGTVLEPTKVGEKRKILAALDRLQAGGSTAGAAGIRQAYALAEGNFDKKAVNRVILATDGDFNVGITNREELKSFVERKRMSGVFLSVLGFGQGNLNDHLMQTLAQNGNGVAAHIDTLNEARKVLVQEASSTLFPIAKDVKIQVEFNPATVAEYRLIGYETRALRREDFNNDKVDAGDIGAGHSVTAIYEITPVGAERMIEEGRYRNSNATRPNAAASQFADEFGFLKIRYKKPDAETSELISAPISASNAATGDGDGEARRQVREAGWSAAVAAFGQILKGGIYTGSFSYDDVIALARASKGEDEFGYRAEFINLVRLARSASALPRN